MEYCQNCRLGVSCVTKCMQNHKDGDELMFKSNVAKLFTFKRWF